MSFHMLGAVRMSACRPVGKEMHMELLAGVPDWLVWCAAGAAGIIALAALASMLDAALELAS